MPSTKCLALHLRAPLQSWGTESKFTERTTGSFPAKSAIAGMICAAFGFPRGSEQERNFLCTFRRMHMLSACRAGDDAGRRSSRLVDFHTVENTPTANGSSKTTVTRRHYLTDAEFFVFLTGPQEIIESIRAALEDPVWGIWFGRKSCVPSAKVFWGIYDDQESGILDVFHGDKFLASEDATGFQDADFHECDNPVSFDSEKRSYSLRHVKRVRAAGGGWHET